MELVVDDVVLDVVVEVLVVEVEVEVEVLVLVLVLVEVVVELVVVVVLVTMAANCFVTDCGNCFSFRMPRSPSVRYTVLRKRSALIRAGMGRLHGETGLSTSPASRSLRTKNEP